MNRSYSTLSLVLLLGCATATAPPPSGPDAPTGSAPAVTRSAAGGASEFRNLLILPRDISRPELTATMRTFTRGLGVRCNHCHVVTATAPEEKLDFASDAKEEKRVARVMLQMALQINEGWMERVEAAEGHAVQSGEMAVSFAPFKEPEVWCWTCHRGKTEPEAPPPPAPRPAA